MNKKTIPIFYACDDTFVKYTIVSLYSIQKNCSKKYFYKIYVLHTDITGKMKEALKKLENDNFSVTFVDVTDYLHSIADKLPIRDYYSKSTYYRFFIAEMFPDFDKAIYIDSDTVVQGDISELYNTELTDSYVGACHDQAFVQVDIFGRYAERVLGISRYNIFNAGVMLINCEAFRKHLVMDKFFHYLKMYNFILTQDEDYLNLICKDHIKWLDTKWNTMVFGDILHNIKEANIIHYVWANKPWHYTDCKFGDIFWGYAEKTPIYKEITEDLESYTDEQRANDARINEKLTDLALSEIERPDNFLNILNDTKRSADRVAITRKIQQYEREGRFDEDVENDPPAEPLMPDDIEYIRRNPVAKVKTKTAFAAARRFVDRLKDEKQYSIKEIKGIENYNSLCSGAIITCNHFNAFDSFAMQETYEASDQKKRKLYRVISEANYTAFPGFYGFLMRNCNTLPLASNRRTLNKFMDAVNTLLKAGHFVLIYPEQSMWWNYRKPKPLKNGAFTFAARNNVPVLPCFITMQDTDILGDDGFFVQEYTVHVCKPIRPDKSLPYAKRVQKLADDNYAAWKQIYEETYGIPLYYESTDDNEAYDIQSLKQRNAE